MTQRGQHLSAEDLREVLFAGFSPQQIEEALAVCAAFNTTDRLTNAFGLNCSTPRASRQEPFPFDDVVVSGKTGTFVATPRGRRRRVPNGETYAVVVFTRSTRARPILPSADAAIAQAAKLAVAALR